MSALYQINKAIPILAEAFFVSGINIFGSHLAHTLEINKCVRTMVWMVSIEKPVSWTILSMPFFVFKHNLVDFMGIFFRTKFDHQDGAYIQYPPSSCELTYPRCNNRVTRGRVDIYIEQMLIDSRRFLSCNDRNRIKVQHSTGPILTIWQTLACLLQFPGYMWYTRDLILYFNGLSTQQVGFTQFDEPWYFIWDAKDLLKPLVLKKVFWKWFLALNINFI